MNGVSLDTNVLLSLWRGEPGAAAVSQALSTLASRTRLVVCGAVYAELAGFYPQLDELLAASAAQPLPDMPLAAWRRAGEAHAAYAQRRKKSGGTLPRRLLTDHLIGAHASIQQLSLFTLNVADYADFPEVPIFTV